MTIVWTILNTDTLGKYNGEPSGKGLECKTSYILLYKLCTLLSLSCPLSIAVPRTNLEAKKGKITFVRQWHKIVCRRVHKRLKASEDCTRDDPTHSKQRSECRWAEIVRISPRRHLKGRHGLHQLQTHIRWRLSRGNSPASASVPAMENGSGQDLRRR